MLDVTYSEVIKLAERLNADEQIALAEHLQELAQQRQLEVDERLALFEAMIVDLGPVPSDFSFSREDWYGAQLED